MKRTVFEGKNFKNNQNYIIGKRLKNKIFSKFIFENFYYGIYKFMYGVKESLGTAHFVGYIYLLPVIIFIATFIEDYSNISIFIFSSPFLYILFFIIKNFSKNTYSNIRNISLSDLFISQEAEMLNTVLIIVFGFIIFGAYIKYTIWFLVFFIFFAFINKKKFKKYLDLIGNSFIFRVRLLQILFIPIYIIIIGLYFILFIVYNLIYNETQYYNIIKKKIYKTKFQKFDFLSKDYAENEFYIIYKKGFKIEKNIYKKNLENNLNKIRI